MTKSSSSGRGVDVEGFKVDEVFEVVGEAAEAVKAGVEDLERVVNGFGKVFNEVFNDIQDLKHKEVANGV
ncbi:hypothetical protein HN51_053903 [Arachis hypogaea]